MPTEPGRCPNCHQLNQLTDTTCAYCHAPLTATQVRISPSSGRRFNPAVLWSVAGAFVLLTTALLAFRAGQNSLVMDVPPPAAKLVTVPPPAKKAQQVKTPAKVTQVKKAPRVVKKQSLPSVPALPAYPQPVFVDPRGYVNAQQDAQRNTRQARQPVRRPKWHHVAEFDGSGIKQTESFTISAHEWRIGWVTKPGEYGAMNFQIYVYNADGTLADIAANVIGADNDETIMRGAGTYYLKMNSGQPWYVEVEEYY